ncbi:bile acid:sodium symporter family protein [Lujinxingia vulgaris]|uniref:Bile acid:sodium symporter family protein n=1 Tax=Lujinxingia vulgaris TaxID=2600176 RepID=A0A5C6X6F6_9DELT|nr:bile acid:sodium symporter family protein [Lujinxingia vulgaris]TXD32191.1 bile acid:sodium symporter family protein [Lujinxingia vulgaris]
MEESVLTSVVLPLSLFIIMLGMGLSLMVDDFRRVVVYPKAVAVGLTNQLVLLPLVGLGLAVALGLSAEMAVGVMIIAACPGGVTSNLITHVSRGDTALSITLTAISGFVTVVTIPLIIMFSLGFFMGEATTVTLPLAQTIGQIVGITVLPVSLGMLLRWRKPALADRLERPARVGSVVVFVVLLIGIIAANIEVLRNHFAELAAVTIGLNVAMMLIGFWSSKLLKLELPQALAISIESGMQNGTLAIVIATSILMQGQMAVPGGIYSLVMFATGGAMMAYFGRKGAEVAAADEGVAVEAA